MQLCTAPCICAVGRKIILYTTCLQSPVWRLRAYHSRFLSFNIYFDIQNLSKTLLELSWDKTWISKKAPNLVVILSLNAVNSCDHNICNPLSTPGLGDQNRNLTMFLLHSLNLYSLVAFGC